MVEAGRIEPQHIGALWPNVSELIANACMRGGGDFAAIERAVMAGDAILWVAHEGPDVLGAAVTQLLMRGPRKICTLYAMGGELDRVRPVLDMLERYAVDAGCDAMEVCGRPGWARILRDYRVTRVEMEKRL